MFLIAEPRREQLIALGRLIDTGTIGPVVEAVRPLARARDAYEHGAREHPRGKLVLADTGDT